MNIGKILFCLVWLSATSAFAGEPSECHGKETYGYGGVLRTGVIVSIDDRVIQSKLKIDKAVALMKQLQGQGKCVINWKSSLVEMGIDCKNFDDICRDAIADLQSQRTQLLKNQNNNGGLAECKKERDSLLNIIANVPAQNKSVTTNLAKQTAEALSKIDSSPKNQQASKSAPAQ